MKTNATLAATAALLAAAPLGRAAIVLSGDFVNGASTPTLTITSDIVFTITGNADARYLVFDEWVTQSDGTENLSFPSPPQNLAYRRNDVGATVEIFFLADNEGAFGQFSPNAGQIHFNPIPVETNDTIRILAGSYTFSSDTDFNPELNGKTFTGNVFLTDGGASVISNTVAVPEPTASLLSGLGMSPCSAAAGREAFPILFPNV